MAFPWPDGVQNKTKRLISQVLWTLHLDFEGAIRDSKDAPLELMTAMEGHGVEIKNPMTFRMILPFMDGGKYGKLITRVVIQRRTKEIRLATRTLPEDSHLPDGAGGIAVDDRIDMQLFGDVAWPPARGIRDATEPARGDTRDELAGELAREIRDTETEPARGPDRDIIESESEPARGTRDVSGDLSRDKPLATADPARGDARDDGFPVLAREDARDVAIEPVRGDARDDVLQSADGARDESPPAAWGQTRDEVEVDDIGMTIRRLDEEFAELLAPLPADDQNLGPHDLLDVVVGLMADLEGLVRAGPAVASPSVRSEEEWAELLTEKHGLIEQLGRLMRRVKDAEARLVERNKEIEGARTQLAVLAQRYERLEANNDALIRGERASGQHLRAAQRFIAETPSDRPERGRSRPNRPNGRTTGSDSTLAYSVG